jgi:hypothetical protein
MARCVVGDEQPCRYPPMTWRVRTPQLLGSSEGRTTHANVGSARKGSAWETCIALFLREVLLPISRFGTGDITDAWANWCAPWPPSMCWCCGMTCRPPRWVARSSAFGMQEWGCRHCTLSAKPPWQGRHTMEPSLRAFCRPVGVCEDEPQRNAKCLCPHLAHRRR